MQDDVRLLNATAMRQEMCATAAVLQPEFFSFFRAPTTQGCFYAWGTQCFFISRDLMWRVADVSYKTSCRLPIDIYIASIGPWPVTAEMLVAHDGDATRHAGFVI